MSPSLLFVDFFYYISGLCIYVCLLFPCVVSVKVEGFTCVNTNVFQRCKMWEHKNPNCSNLSHVQYAVMSSSRIITYKTPLKIRILLHI
ncbi:hypothetical protein Hdeb2414_s0010g00350521 [Helianthus debilis subsp. tardiflorus]